MALPLLLVTGNRGKREEAERIVGEQLRSVALELPEPQSLDMHEIVREKARAAFAAVGEPVVVEDTGLELAALAGFPGPLVKWMLVSVGAAGIARTAAALDDTAATARCVAVWFDGEREVFGEGATTGSLVPPRGESGFGWDAAFQPDGEHLTYAELPAEAKDRVGHRGRAWRDLLEKLAAAGL